MLATAAPSGHYRIQALHRPAGYQSSSPAVKPTSQFTAGHKSFRPASTTVHPYSKIRHYLSTYKVRAPIGAIHYRGTAAEAISGSTSTAVNTGKPMVGRKSFPMKIRVQSYTSLRRVSATPAPGSGHRRKWNGARSRTGVGRGTVARP